MTDDLSSEGSSSLPSVGAPGRRGTAFGQGAARPGSGDGGLLVVSDPTPALERAVTFLAQDRAQDALLAASEACHLAPDTPQPHYVYGQAWARLGRPDNAERAFAAALQRAPDWADAWVNYGVARYRQNALDDAIQAMREALRRSPEHPAALANLAAFLPAAPDTGAGSHAIGPRVMPVADPASALGLAVAYLMDKAAFASLPFRIWSRVLAGQVARGHFRLFADREDTVCGFFGWSLTEEAAAQAWLAGQRDLTSDECREGDCVIFNAWAADTPGIHRVMVGESRRLFADKRAGYYKRYYPDGRVRLARLPGNAFVHNHLNRADAAG